MLAAVDCIVFGFDGQTIRLLLVQRAIEPEKGKWSLMGGFVQPNESADGAAARVLEQLTGLRGVYLEQLHTFTEPSRDPIERTISIAYFSLIDISQYEKQLSDEYHAEWFDLGDAPRLIFDHEQMLQMAKEKLKYKAGLHPLLFELLPRKFTVPQLQTLFESVYETKFDKRNFSRKLHSTGLLVRLPDKDMSSSRKGAFFYKLNSKNYKAKFQDFLNLIPRAKRGADVR